MFIFNNEVRVYNKNETEHNEHIVIDMKGNKLNNKHYNRKVSNKECEIPQFFTAAIA